MDIWTSHIFDAAKDILHGILLIYYILNMNRYKIEMQLDGGDNGCARETGYIIVSDGNDRYAIRAASVKIPVVNLEDIGCRFTHAYYFASSGLCNFSREEIGSFLHDQRMKLAGIIGPIKFAEIDTCICRKLRSTKDL